METVLLFESIKKNAPKFENKLSPSCQAWKEGTQQGRKKMTTQVSTSQVLDKTEGAMFPWFRDITPAGALFLCTARSAVSGKTSPGLSTVPHRTAKNTLSRSHQ